MRRSICSSPSRQPKNASPPALDAHALISVAMSPTWVVCFLSHSCFALAESDLEVYSVSSLNLHSVRAAVGFRPFSIKLATLILQTLIRTAIRIQATMQTALDSDDRDAGEKASRAIHICTKPLTRTTTMCQATGDIWATMASRTSCKLAWHHFDLVVSRSSHYVSASCCKLLNPGRVSCSVIMI
jgi:hypothetical protein